MKTGLLVLAMATLLVNGSTVFAMGKTRNRVLGTWMVSVANDSQRITAEFKIEKDRLTATSRCDYGFNNYGYAHLRAEATARIRINNRYIEVQEDANDVQSEGSLTCQARLNKNEKIFYQVDNDHLTANIDSQSIVFSRY